MPRTFRELKGYEIPKRKLERAKRARRKSWEWKRRRDDTRRSISELYIMEWVNPT